MRLRTWAISVDNDGNEHLYMFQSEQQPDLDKDLLPLMEKDGITMVSEQWEELKANAWSDEISLTVHGPLDITETSFCQADNLARLWWRAESLEEVGKWTAQIVGLGGSIDKIEQELDGTCFAFVFTVPTEVAIHNLGYDSTSLEYFALNEMPESEPSLDESSEAKASVERGVDVTPVDMMQYVVSMNNRDDADSFPTNSFSEARTVVEVQTVVEALSLVLSNRFVSPVEYTDSVKILIDQAHQVVSKWKQETMTEVWYRWMDISRFTDGTTELVSPCKPGSYDLFNYFYKSPEAAMEDLIKHNGQPGWILCRETLESIAPPVSQAEFEQLKLKFS